MPPEPARSAGRDARDARDAGRDRDVYKDSLHREVYRTERPDERASRGAAETCLLPFKVVRTFKLSQTASDVVSTF